MSKKTNNMKDDGDKRNICIYFICLFVIYLIAVPIIVSDFTKEMLPIIISPYIAYGVTIVGYIVYNIIKNRRKIKQYEKKEKLMTSYWKKRKLCPICSQELPYHPFDKCKFCGWVKNCPNCNSEIEYPLRVCRFCGWVAEPLRKGREGNNI